MHCVIIGFAKNERKQKFLFDYPDLKSEPESREVSTINGYLVEASHVPFIKRRQPICNVPLMGYGSKPTDGGFFLFNEQEKQIFEIDEPLSKKYFRRFIKANEFINNEIRYCLWLKDCAPDELRKMPLVIDRISNIKKLRLASTAAPTRGSANTPHLFFYINQPTTSFLLIPGISSENRTYIPIGFLSTDYIAGDNTWVIPLATLFHFGILQSKMHIEWTRTVSGRIKSDFQYSASIVYNNFPWPENPSDKQKDAIEVAAQAVLDARTQFSGSSLADLYDPLAMPPVLLKAHHALDKTVDAAYGKTSFKTEAERVAFLFELYQKYASFLPVEKSKKAKKERM